MLSGPWNPEIQFTICPFRARIWPSQAPKTLRFKGKMANFEAKNTINQGKTPKGQMVPISRVYPPPQKRKVQRCVPVTSWRRGSKKLTKVPKSRQKSGSFSTLFRLFRLFRPPGPRGPENPGMIFGFFSTLVNSVHTRCIAKTSGLTSGVCKNHGFY